MSLRIGYITDERFPSVHTDCQQMVKTADALGGQGCAVDFIQPRLARHLLMTRKKRKTDICRAFNVEGRFEVSDILLWPASDLRIEKLVHGLAAPLAALLRGYDVVYTRNLLPLRLGAALGLPVLFETYRALPRSDPRAWRTVEKAARAPGFLGICTHSGYSRGIMIEAGADPESVAAIPNGYDPRDFEGVPDKDGARRELKLSGDRPMAVYTGHIRPDKGIASVVDLAEDLPDVSFVIAGGSPSDVARVESDVRTRGLLNVRLVGQVPVVRVPFYLRAADVLLLPPTSGALAAGRTVLPMKTFTYLAAGRPVLAPDLPDTAGILTHEGNSLRVPPDDRKAAALALSRLVLDKGLRERLGTRGALDAELYTWNGRAKRLVEFMERRRTAAGRKGR
ncbi:MAG: glycosyltransferase family 4 protein [Deltaproteobacteria bacterium]|nr:glycosyltransferase family 4 protein [Deltaproteobacteria bacterium]